MELVCENHLPPLVELCKGIFKAVPHRYGREHFCLTVKVFAVSVKFFKKCLCGVNTSVLFKVKFVFPGGNVAVRCLCFHTGKGVLNF